MRNTRGNVPGNRRGQVRKIVCPANEERARVLVPRLERGITLFCGYKRETELSRLHFSFLQLSAGHCRRETIRQCARETHRSEIHSWPCFVNVYRAVSRYFFIRSHRIIMTTFFKIEKSHYCNVCWKCCDIIIVRLVLIHRREKTLRRDGFS